MKTGYIYIGTSGWSYKSWAETFYPAGLPPGKQLAYYTTKFPTVEVNRTFYRLPTEKAFCDWNGAGQCVSKPIDTIDSRVAVDAGVATRFASACGTGRDGDRWCGTEGW